MKNTRIFIGGKNVTSKYKVVTVKGKSKLVLKKIKTKAESFKQKYERLLHKSLIKGETLTPAEESFLIEAI